MEEQIKCPRCGSTQITAKGKGFSTGKALAGGAIAGVGGAIVGGMLGSGKIMLTCLKCGYEWKPSENIASADDTSSYISDDKKMTELINDFSKLVEKDIIKQKFFEKKRDEILELRRKVSKTMTKKKPNQKIIGAFIQKIRTIKELINAVDNVEVVGEKHIKRLIKDLK